MSKAKFAAAKELINEKKYDEARSILKTIDHPTAREWEVKLNNIAPPITRHPSPTEPIKPAKVKRPLISVRGCLVVAVVVIVIYILTPKSPPPTTKADPTFTESERAAIASTSTAQKVALIGTEAVSNLTATVIALTPPTATVTLTPSPTITDTPLPTSTATATITPTSTATPSLEDQARQIINNNLAGDNIERISIIDVGSPKLLTVDYPMPGIFSPDVDFAGREMLKVACALYQSGFTDDWRFQFSAMVDVVNKATGQTSRIDGLSTRISTSRIAQWNCANTSSMDAKLAVDEYILDPVMSN